MLCLKFVELQVCYECNRLWDLKYGMGYEEVYVMGTRLQVHEIGVIWGCLYIHSDVSLIIYFQLQFHLCIFVNTIFRPVIFVTVQPSVAVGLKCSNISLDSRVVIMSSTTFIAFCSYVLPLCKGYPFSHRKRGTFFSVKVLFSLCAKVLPPLHIGKKK